MFRREGRMGHPEHEDETHGRDAGGGSVIRWRWERPAIVIIAIAALVLGGIAGMNWLTSQFPWMH